MSRCLTAIDLFAGMGGFSEGAEMAGCRVLWAANHWREAVDVHAANHPATAHECQDLQQADWSRVPEVDVVLASPACQGHSLARGKERSHHDAARSTAWAVVSVAECRRPEVIVVENVKEFMKWTLYPAWCAAMTALGYAIAPHLLDSANHGVPQNRVRMFAVLTRSKHPLQLTFAPQPEVNAASVIDFDGGNWSPVNKPGRSLATLARIAEGRKCHGARFLAPFYGSGSGLTGRSIHRPIGTITTRDRWAIVDGDRMRIPTKEENRDFMGFRRSYILPSSHKLATFMLGNAVAPKVARDVIVAIRSQG